MHLRYEIVDVFTDRAYAGNPLAVVLDADDLPTAAMQALAREFNLSETAFPLRPSVPDADYDLRIFNPVAEMPFAGHPSVGTAWLLARLGRVAPGEVRQHCIAGVLPLRIAPDGGPVELTAAPPETGPELDAVPLLAALGLAAADAGSAPPRLCSTGLPQVFLEVRDPALAAIRPDGLALGTLLATGWDAVSAFSWDAARRVAHARVLAAAGDGAVLEDPATGSAACALGAWLVASGYLPGDGESAYAVEQGREIGRPSRLDCTVVAAAGRAVECRVSGRVAAVARGEVLVPSG